MPGETLELSVTRLIDAPVETVWKIVTERMAEWWCPKPWTVEIVEQDWRAGGRSAMVMRGPNGEEMPQEGVFLEVSPGERFVFTDAFTTGWHPKTPFMVGRMEFAAEDGKTRYTGSARHWTREAYEQHKAMGFEQGWAAVAEQLAALAEAETKTPGIEDVTKSTDGSTMPDSAMIADSSAAPTGFRHNPGGSLEKYCDQVIAGQAVRNVVGRDSVGAGQFRTGSFAAAELEQWTFAGAAGINASDLISIVGISLSAAAAWRTPP